VLRMGSGEPLVLLHGVMGSERMWREVAPLLATDHDVIAPTALGHNGGPRSDHARTRYSDVVDAAERQLDQLGLDRAHLVGNSMGGWMALDLARRGRARSVCAISPAGMWLAESSGSGARAKRLGEALRMGRRTRPLLPVLYRSRRVRKFALRNIAADGGARSPSEALGLTDDMLGCEIAEDMLATDEHFAVLDPLPCPITIVWCELDRIFPEPEYGARARVRVPGAHYVVLEGVGHVPMLDDPGLVVTAIRDALVHARSGHVAAD